MKKDRLKEAFKKFIEQAYKYCILGLFVCWFMKLFGIDWFDINLNNKMFMDLDSFLNNHIVLKYIYYIVTLNIQLYFLTCAVQKKQGKDIWIYLLKLLPFTIFVRIATSNGNIFGNYRQIVEIIYLIIVTSCFKGRKSIKGIFTILFLTLYQYISLKTRSLDIQKTSYGFVAAQILSVDLYLMLYLHKEVEVRRMDDNTWIFFGLTAWIYGVAGAIVGIFKLHPIRTAKEWYARGKEKENARKTEKELKKIRGK